MNVTVRIPDELAARLEAAGADFERLALEALRHAAEELEQRGQQPASVSDEARRAVARVAAERIIERRKGVTLGGATIRELINEGRR
jgi:predicted transcriptional regulator